MSKVWLFLCVVLSCNVANAMDKIEIIRDIPDMQKEKIYKATKQWVAKTFVSAKDVIQFDDQEEGTLILKGNIDYPCSTTWSCGLHSGEFVKFTMKIDIKDQKIRVAVNDVSVSYTNTFGRDVEQEPNARQTGILNKRFLGLSNSVVLAVEKASETKEDDNW